MENRIREAGKEKRKAFSYSQEELAEKIGKTSRENRMVEYANRYM